MTFIQSPIALQAGIFANRSRRASQNRWCDGNLVRFRDGVPEQIGGWEVFATTGPALSGVARSMIAWRPNDSSAQFAAIGTSSRAYQLTGGRLVDISPADMVVGRTDSVPALGFGSGVFGAGTFGTPRATSNLSLDADSWSFDMFGETLLACFTGTGGLYSYTDATDANLQRINGAPIARAIVISDERHVFAFGADGIPGKVSWSDRENYSAWTPLPTNRAGGYDLQVRSAFQCGARVRGAVLGWTQSEVFEFQPLGNALVYDRERISTEAGAAGPRAVAVVTDSAGETAYWIGTENFFLYDGLVRVLPCELHDYVFRDMNRVQAAKFHATVNAAFGEIWFGYCSAGSSEIDRAVIYSYATDTWSKAAVARTTWLPSGVFPKPLAISPANIMYRHEAGDTAAGQPMGSFVVSHPITIAVGQRLAEVDQFWPDMQAGSTPCAVSFICRDQPGGASYTVGPFPFALGDGMVPTGFTAREFDLRIDGLAGHWELGIPLISMQGGSLK